MQLREYTRQEHEADRKQENSTPTTTDNSVKETSISPVNSKLEYDIIDADKKLDESILEFIPVESTQKKIQETDKSQILTNEIIPLDTTTPRHSYRKSKISLHGSKPSKGFRSSSSVTGYHASTSPENFLKKKYKSEHLRKAQRKVFAGSLERVPKSELYQHIMAHYKKGGIRRGKKKLRRKMKKKHRS